jgi:hypothetical protein
MRAWLGAERAINNMYASYTLAGCVVAGVNRPYTAYRVSKHVCIACPAGVEWCGKACL